MLWMKSNGDLTRVIEEWQMSADGLSWTYKVRKGVTFQDGSNLTAKDVKFTIERYMSSEAYTSTVRNWAERVEQVDE